MKILRKYLSQLLLATLIYCCLAQTKAMSHTIEQNTLPPHSLLQAQ